MGVRLVKKSVHFFPIIFDIEICDLGLPEPDKKGKKGKKKSNAKTTLSLQNFMNLQESNNQVRRSEMKR